jgi:hypothetical protein
MRYVVIGWDAPDSKERRPEARPDHLAHWKDWCENGKLVMAGPMTDFAGSLFIVESDSEEEVKAKIAADPFAVRGVFTRWEVHPWKKTLPNAD